MAHSLGFYGIGVSFQVVSGLSFSLRVLPDDLYVAQQGPAQLVHVAAA